MALPARPAHTDGLSWTPTDGTNIMFPNVSTAANPGVCWGTRWVSVVVQCSRKLTPRGGLVVCSGPLCGAHGHPQREPLRFRVPASGQAMPCGAPPPGRRASSRQLHGTFLAGFLVLPLPLPLCRRRQCPSASPREQRHPSLLGYSLGRRIEPAAPVRCSNSRVVQDPCSGPPRPYRRGLRRPLASVAFSPPHRRAAWKPLHSPPTSAFAVALTVAIARGSARRGHRRGLSSAPKHLPPALQYLQWHAQV
jgi:hypothetical protein